MSTGKTITAEPIVETIASSPRGHDAVRARYVPLLSDPTHEFSNCALSQLALVIEPHESDMTHLVGRCLKRRHFPAVRTGTPLGHVMDQLRQSASRNRDIYDRFNAHQMGYMDPLEPPDTGRFEDLVRRLDSEPLAQPAQVE